MEGRKSMIENALNNSSSEGNSAHFGSDEIEFLNLIALIVANYAIRSWQDVQEGETKDDEKWMR